MNLIGKKVQHKLFGLGCIIAQDDSHITVEFSSEKELKQFQISNCFQKHLWFSPENREMRSSTRIALLKMRGQDAIVVCSCIFFFVRMEEKDEKSMSVEKWFQINMDKWDNDDEDNIIFLVDEDEIPDSVKKFVEERRQANEVAEQIAKLFDKLS